MNFWRDVTVGAISWRKDVALPLVFGAPSRTSRILHNRDGTHLLEYLVRRISGEGLCLTASSKFKKTRTSPCQPG